MFAPKFLSPILSGLTYRDEVSTFSLSGADRGAPPNPGGGAIAGLFLIPSRRRGGRVYVLGLAEKELELELEALLL